MHLFTTLTLLVMAAGLWFAGPAGVSVPAPRLQVAEARVAAAENAIADEPAPEGPADAEGPAVVSVAVPASGPVVAAPVALTPAAPHTATGPRAPPRG